MSKNTMIPIGQHEIDRILSMRRMDLNNECLHLMREQLELTQEVHDAKAEIQRLRTTLNNIIKHAESRQCVVEEELLKECEVLHSGDKRSRKLHRALSGEMGSLGTILKRAEGSC